MAKMKVGIIGSGGRSRLYIDAIKLLQDDFELVQMRFRTQEKADRFAKEYGIPVTTSVDELKSAKPAFVVNAVNRPDVGKVTMADFLDEGIPVLAETPPAESIDEIRELWDRTAEKNYRILVAENYFAEPGWAARLEAARRGYLGDVQAVTVSNTHEYHAISMIRLFLGCEYTPLSVIGKKMMIDLTLTQEKDGRPIRDGRTEKVERYHTILNFENGKTGIYDFAIAQYWSAIRSRYCMIQGSKGEIKDDDIWYVDKNYDPKQAAFRRNTRGDDLISISIGDDVVYENKLIARGVGRNLGICHMLLNMKQYLETGDAPYPFKSAMQDAYITQLFLEAGRRPFELIRSEKQPWNS
jgi:predicted dehydrogenase